jgi:hypothetical protein
MPILVPKKLRGTEYHRSIHSVKVLLLFEPCPVTCWGRKSRDATRDCRGGGGAGTAVGPDLEAGLEFYVEAELEPAVGPDLEAGLEFYVEAELEPAVGPDVEAGLEPDVAAGLAHAVESDVEAGREPDVAAGPRAPQIVWTCSPR